MNAPSKTLQEWSNCGSIASLEAVVQYASMAHHVHVHDIHPRSTTVEHLRIEDNLGSKYLEEGL